MSHLENHALLFPVGLRIGTRTVAQNGIKKKGGYHIKLLCDCGNTSTTKTSDIRNTCQGCKKKKSSLALPHAREFRNESLGETQGSLVSVEVVRGQGKYKNHYFVIYYCKCAPKTFYKTTFQKWIDRKNFYCSNCAPVGTYVPKGSIYKTNKTNNKRGFL